MNSPHLPDRLPDHLPDHSPGHSPAIPPESSPESSLESPHKGQRGLQRLFNALLYSLSGLSLALRHESAFRQEVALAIVLMPLACFVDVTAGERVLLFGSVLLVLLVELLNSSVEAAVDRIGFDTHRLSKRAKDLGSAAVLIALLMLTITWALLAVPSLIRIGAALLAAPR